MSVDELRWVEEAEELSTTKRSPRRMEVESEEVAAEVDTSDGAAEPLTASVEDIG